MHTALLVIHILSVVVWLGAGIGAAYLGPRFVNEGGNLALTWMRTADSMGPKLYGPASGLTLLSGIGLVLTTEAYSFGSWFVILGMAVWVAVAIGNGAYAGPREKKALESFESGDDHTGQETFRKLNPFIAIEFVLLVAVVIAMVYRWGA